MKFKRTVALEKGRLDIAPLIDVIFLLLIFFMLTSSFILQPGIRVNLPKAVTSEVLHEGLVVVVVTADNNVYVNERPVDTGELTSHISMAAREDMSVLIKADKEADLGRIIEVWDMCRKMDIQQVNIATSEK